MAGTDNPRDGASRFVKCRPAITDGPWIDPLLGEWTTWQRAARRSKETLKLRAPIVQNFAEEISVSPVSACHGDIIEWFERHPEWSPATARTYWGALSSWFKWLCRQGYREDNPMVKLDPPHLPACTPRPISDEDLRRLLVANIRKRTRVMILLAALAGLRVSEIARVRGEDIDLAGRLLYVRGKGGSLKTVPLHPMLVEAAAGMPAKGCWFPARDASGNPISGKSVSYTISKAMRRNGVRATPHALRHWFGTKALRVSGDLRAVQTLMRHASVISTQIYTDVANDTRADVVAKLDVFGGLQDFLDGE